MGKSVFISLYCSNLVYNNDRLSTILFDGGYASVDEGDGIVMHFYVKDHLGSNRLVVDGNGNIEEVNHYYPFGALMGDRCGVSRNKYKYIGKELDTMYGWNMQDHEARWYDPVVGKWMVTDPLQEKYASVSSYCYVINNPIKYMDPNSEKLILAGNQQERMQLLKFLQKLTNDNLFVNRNTGEVTIGNNRWSNRNKKLQTGTSLLRDVIYNKHTTTIYKNTNNERIAKSLEKWGRKEFKHPTGSIPGSDAIIDIDLSPTTNTVRNSKTKCSENGYTPTEITLGHELIHCLRYMEGVSTSKEEDYQYIDGDNIITEKKQSVEELETIGLGKYKQKYKYTENKLRKEHHFQQRITHLSNE